jgi:gluconolactonase
MIFADGLSVPEGPVALKDGRWLCVEMGSDRGSVTLISADGQSKQVLARTGRPNGLAVDRDGIIWVAESLSPALLRMCMDGSYDVFATGNDDRAFIFPNDLAFGPNGLLYMTDSGIPIQDFAPNEQIRPDYATCNPNGCIFQIDTHTGAIRRFDSGIRFTNGIAVGTDGYLYVNETLTGNVYRYRLANGEVGPRETFGNVIDPQAAPGFKGPDGMKFGLDGCLYVTVFGQQDVTVLGRDGGVVRRIRLHGKKPTNLAFGLPGDSQIYVTEDELGNLEVHEAGTYGLPLFG